MRAATGGKFSRTGGDAAETTNIRSASSRGATPWDDPHGTNAGWRPPKENRSDHESPRRACSKPNTATRHGPQAQLEHGEVRPGIADLLFPIPHTFFTSQKSYSIANRSASTSTISRPKTFGAVQKNSQPCVSLQSPCTNHAPSWSISGQEGLDILGNQLAVDEACDRFPTRRMGGTTGQVDPIPAVRAWPTSSASLPLFILGS